MRLTTTILAALLLCVAGTTALAQEGEKSRPSLMGSNSEGFHFMVGFMQNEIYDPPPLGTDFPWSGYLAISISSRFDAKVRIQAQGGLPFDTLIEAYTVAEIQINPVFECVGESVTSSGIEVTSDRPISVSCYNGKQTTSDGYLALPINAWGKEYVSACYYVDQYDDKPNRPDWDRPRRGEFAVMAAYDDTRVTVYPSTRTRGGVGVGQAYTRVLRKGDIFQVQDGGEQKRSDWWPGTDLTGSVITADKPVGVLSGHMRTGVPTVHDSKDHLVEMLPPTTALGKRYMTVPFDGRLGGDVLRVISTTSAPTSVTIASASMGTTTTRLMRKGEFYDYDLFDAVVVSADQQIMVVQYARSAYADPRNTPTVKVHFDPDMVVLTPEEQFVNGAIFATLANYNDFLLYRQFEHHYVTIIGERSGFDLIELDGRPLGSLGLSRRGDIPGTGYVWATIEIPEQTTHVLSGRALFAGYLYGLGDFDSYAWPIGSGLRNASLPDPIPPTMAASPVCGGTEIVVLDSGIAAAGLRDVWLDTVVSVNARLEKPPVPFGSEMWIGTVRAIDARSTASARVWAEDLVGNRTYIDVTLAASAPAFSSDTISMGNVEIGKAYSRFFTIANSGTASVLVDSVYLVRGKEYILERAYRNIALAPEGGQLTLRIIFAPLSLSRLTDTLVLVIDCLEYRIPLMAFAAAPQIATNGWDFGRVRLGRTGGPGRILVVNNGDADLVVDSAQIVGATFSRRNELRWPVTIRPGSDTLAMEVYFQPIATTTFTGEVRFFSNVADSVAVGELTGRGIYPTLSILGHDFGRVLIGDTLCTTIPVANIGSDTAFLTGLDLPTPEGFSYDRSVFPHALPEGDTLWVPVCFAPTAEQSYLSDVSPRNDDDLTAMNSLRGSGYRLRATLSGADMGRLWIGETHDSVVYVTNVGTDPITITRVWLEGGDAGDFIVEPLNAEQTIAPGGRLPVIVHFSPLVAGHREAYIHAETASRHQPQLDSVLTGFGLLALSSDVLTFDDALAFSCEERGGRLVITNEGNAPLTLATIGFTASPAIMTIDAPPAGHVIAVGESLVIEFNLAFGGYSGVTQGTITWSFEEPPNLASRREFTREFSISSKPQRYVISATSPAQVIPGETYEVSVRVDSADWIAMGEREVRVVVEHDPTMTMFDEAAWTSASQPISGWRRGAVRYVSYGAVEVQYLSDLPLPLVGSELPAIPFRSFVGARKHDSLRATLRAVGNACAAPALAATGIGLDSVCGLSVRLFEFTGEAFVLRQNRPDPVRDRTEILFTLALDAPTRLELFAEDGRLVRVLLDETLAAGDHAVALDVAEIASGVYFYRLTSGPFSAVRRMQIAQ